MEYQVLFSLKKKTIKKYLLMSSAAVVIGACILTGKNFVDFLLPGTKTVSKVGHTVSLNKTICSW